MNTDELNQLASDFHKTTQELATSMAFFHAVMNLEMDPITAQQYAEKEIVFDESMSI